MRRKTLDIIFSGSGAAIAVLLVVLGFVLTSQAAFARDYVKEQLGEQRVTFASEDALSEHDRTWKPGSTCLVENAGKPLETGAQAECYANYYIAMHMRDAAARPGYGWETETYATMGGVQRALRGELAAAQEAGDPAKVEAIQEQLDAATALRSTFQTGETLRGLLLTTFGFSIFGEKAALAGDASLAGAALLALLSLAGLVHALATPGSQLISHRDEDEDQDVVDLPRAA